MMTANEFNTEVIPLTDKLFRYTYRLLGDQEEARDAVQEVFVKLWNLREQMTSVRNIEAFAVRTARNYCLDMIKSRRTVSLDEYDFIQNRHAEYSDPQEEIQRSEAVGLLREIIRALPEPQRSVIWFRDVEGYESKEICSMLSMNDGNLRVVLSRARRRVREEFLKSYGYDHKRNQSIITEVL
ncbi:MAG: RNA polymerase sigma factor [Bacteroidales bacterium]|nr:RNA polymerase sigma factor [Bacteroidales bacterium]